eukprot:CAMPEP_0179114700 /NCGR_PEP_ID=MMETSP0796-20121207/53721_1 /TAXON_ID=73915 /ORGANISM="Pyrodinium bahamense, Strain pbaha01" /LENGTH=103 /DNA_ID=CAMNT_0020812931 /DNA_START=310 /DNA_END=621 /DNA_ORIENTATION=+
MPMTQPEKSPEKAPFQGNPRPPRVSSQEANDVRKHHEPASNAGWNGALRRMSKPAPSGGKTIPKIPPATRPRKNDSTLLLTHDTSGGGLFHILRPSPQQGLLD